MDAVAGFHLTAREPKGAYFGDRVRRISLGPSFFDGFAFAVGQCLAPDQKQSAADIQPQIVGGSRDTDGGTGEALYGDADTLAAPAGNVLSDHSEVVRPQICGELSF